MLFKVAGLVLLAAAGCAEIKNYDLHLKDLGAVVPSQKTVDRHFNDAKDEFERRWAAFSAGRRFQPWSPYRLGSDAEEEWLRLNKERMFAWYDNLDCAVRESHPDYSIAEELVVADHVRIANCVAFKYNQSCSYFNASNINIEGLRFIAAEGTRSKDEAGFFHMLLNYHVKKLVRLTSDCDGPKKKCHPYWKGRMIPNGDCEWILSIPRKDGHEVKIPYFICEEWVDNQATSAEALLHIIEAVRKDYDPASDLIAVHCSAGVGRTGTFIAGFTLLHLIDQQIAERKGMTDLQISVEEVVAKLSLQRFHMVGQKVQHANLYRLVDLYLETKGMM